MTDLDHNSEQLPAADVLELHRTLRIAVVGRVQGTCLHGLASLCQPPEGRGRAPRFA